MKNRTLSLTHVIEEEEDYIKKELYEEKVGKLKKRGQLKRGEKLYGIETKESYISRERVGR